MIRLHTIAAGCLVLAAAPAATQTIPAARIAVLVAEARNASEPRDLATLRTATRSADGETARMAIRAIGRLGRPALVPDLVPALRFTLPELRAEAACAIASAVNGTASPAAKTTNVALALSSLMARLGVDDEPSVRGAILESLGRLPYTDTRQILEVDEAFIARGHSEFVAERLAVARGFESLIRLNRTRWTPPPASLMLLRELAGVSDTQVSAELRTVRESTPTQTRDVRIRRLAVEALMTAGAVDGAVLQQMASDPDPQVRRFAMRAVPAVGYTTSETITAVRAGLADPQPMVRIEALRIAGSGPTADCRDFLAATADPTLQVGLTAIDLVAQCTSEPRAVDVLSQIAADLPETDEGRVWNRGAHALTALSRLAPEQARSVLPRFVDSRVWQLRLSAVQVAQTVADQPALEKLAADPDSRVSVTARERMGLVSPATSRHAAAPTRDLVAADLQRLASGRARITIRGVGTLEIALLPAEAPATVLWFANAAETGRFDRVPLGHVLASLITIAPETEEAARPLNRGELGSWPHVRGTLGLLPSESGNDDRIFIDLVDNPRFDHVHPVFAQILNGIDLLDQLLEGDIIERIEIIPGS